MSKVQKLSIVATVILVILVAFGCSDDDPVSPESNTAAAIARVYPVDGSSGLSTSASVSVAFTRPVDTMSVMNNFHLVGGAQMHEWRDSLDHAGGWGMMGMTQQNHMMGWMDTIHTTGTFHWNNNHDSCEFVPTGQLDPNSDYLCVLDESGMQDGQGGMMGGMGQSSDDLQRR